MARTDSALLIAVVFCLTTGIGQQMSMHPSTQIDVPSTSERGIGRTKYVGDSGCLSCHQDRALSYLHTAHHLTSQLGTKEAILGSFQNRSNLFMIADPTAAEKGPDLYFRMDAKNDGYYQTAVTGWPGQLQKRSERMDVVIGSGYVGRATSLARRSTL
jgi:hypothetical protein